MAEYDLTKLNELVDKFVLRYQDELIYNNKYATGKLAESVSSEIVVGDSSIVISISADETWKYVEYGRKPGKCPPPDAILSWIQVRGLPRSNYSAATGGTELPTEKQLAFLISRKIGRDGIPAGNYLSTVVSKSNIYDNVKSVVADMVRERIMKQAQETIDKNIQVNI